jgi:hypothetical protein
MTFRLREWFRRLWGTPGCPTESGRNAPVRVMCRYGSKPKGTATSTPVGSPTDSTIT